MQSTDLRKIARIALERGDIDADTFWQLAQKATHGDTPPAVLFGPYLPPEKLRAILVTIAPEASEAAVQTIASNDRLLQVSRPQEAPNATIADPVFSLDPELSVTPNTGPAKLKTRLEEVAPDSSRYRLGEVLGKGGAGAVYQARDMMLMRHVALKTIRRDITQDEETQTRFLAEAHITAKLEHPSVIPVYDMGILPDGSTFYTMRVVNQRSLRQVLNLSTPRAEWPLARLCGVFVQVCRALSYAHSQGIVHRDLKPENILLGEYGEVYVADWGIAKRLKDKERSQPTMLLESDGQPEIDTHTQVGVTLGTPGYMAPEQIKGDWERLDHRADLFSLGVILYELLTNQKPFRGKNAITTLYATLGDEPVHPKDLNPGCPLLLQELCLSLLQKEMAKRPQDASHSAKVVESYLEGEHEKLLRQEEARKLRIKAAERLAQHYQYREEHSTMEKQSSAMLREIPQWESVEKKLPAWEAQMMAGRAKGMSVCALMESTDLYMQALGYDPNNHEAAHELAEIYLIHAKQYEEQRNKPAQRYFEGRALHYDPSRIEWIQAEAEVSIETQPGGARVTLYKYEEKQRSLRLEQERELGVTPLSCKLPQGSYLAVINHPGFAPLRYPFVCQRGSKHSASLKLYTQKELGQNFALVPRGNTIFGGDSEAFAGLPRREHWVEDFSMAKYPVTIAEYFEFINHLQQHDPKEARKRMPRESAAEMAHAELRGGRWVPKVPDVLLTGATPFTKESDMRGMPLFGIDWFDAVAYCKWKSQTLGGRYRLATEAEYEKACRGADGRFFPWGDFFDATFTKTSFSRLGDQYMEEPGQFPIDESPYGIFDLAGCMRAWLGDIDGRMTAEEALQAPEPLVATMSAGTRTARGSAWWNDKTFSRACSRTILGASLRFVNLGIRLVKEL